MNTRKEIVCVMILVSITLLMKIYLHSNLCEEITRVGDDFFGSNLATSVADPTINDSDPTINDSDPAPRPGS